MSAFVIIWVNPWLNPSPPWADIICKWPLYIHSDMRSRRDFEQPPRLSGKPSAYFYQTFLNFFWLSSAHMYSNVCYSDGELNPSDWALPCVPHGTWKTSAISWWRSLNAVSHNSCSAQQRCWVELHKTSICVASKLAVRKSMVQSALMHSTRERKSRKSERTLPCKCTIH